MVADRYNHRDSRDIHLLKNYPLLLLLLLLDIGNNVLAVNRKAVIVFLINKIRETTGEG